MFIAPKKQSKMTAFDRGRVWVGCFDVAVHVGLAFSSPLVMFHQTFRIVFAGALLPEGDKSFDHRGFRAKRTSVTARTNANWRKPPPSRYCHVANAMPRLELLRVCDQVSTYPGADSTRRQRLRHARFLRSLMTTSKSSKITPTNAWEYCCPAVFCFFMQRPAIHPFLTTDNNFNLIFRACHSFYH